MSGEYSLPGSVLTSVSVVVRGGRVVVYELTTVSC